MKITALSIWFMLAWILTSSLSAQNAKKYFKTGNDYLKENRFEQAIQNYNRALKMEPDYEDVYLVRAQAFEKLGQTQQAADDYIKATRFFEKETDVFYHAGRLLYELGEYQRALSYLDKAIDIKSKNLEAVQLKVLVYIDLNDYYKALRAAKEALDLKTNAFNYYYHGIASENINIVQGAKEDFKEAISEDESFIPAYIALARLQLADGEIESAFQNINYAIEQHPEQSEAYIIRSKIHSAKLNYAQAIDDISKAIVLSDESTALYQSRAKYYIDFTQFPNAIADLNKVIQSKPGDVEALSLRAACYEEISNKKAAIRDYETVRDVLVKTGNRTQSLEKIEQRLFDLKRETKKPELTLVNPKPVNNLLIEVPTDKAMVQLNGILTDDNAIRRLAINDQNIPVTKRDNQTFEFDASVKIDPSELITISATDIYDNVLQTTFTVKRTEIEAPDISVLAPYASENNEIILSEEGPYLYIEGKIKDESLIDLIMIDDVIASYRPEDLNPTFTATVDIENKEKFTIQVVDRFGNKANKEYHLDKDNIAEMESNPMGKTWVVFIENSSYAQFTSLEGPSTDISIMKSALANYKIHNIIHKKDMSKYEMERFFSIELRDLVRSNQVNSIMIWYAGHGKVINETGYWIPVDAKHDEEFSFFNINALKASMQSYSRYVTHTLVITDACESGPSFFQAMRSAVIPPECGNWKSTKFKSSQVFTSAGEQSASDDSQFARTFAATLSNNPDACIPIEEIVLKVTSAVSHISNQDPQFGKISGLEDEDGTFFFIARER
jgi:tetratricopeptide (TPR) repeat protein